MDKKEVTNQVQAAYMKPTSALSTHMCWKYRHGKNSARKWKPKESRGSCTYTTQNRPQVKTCNKRRRRSLHNNKGINSSRGAWQHSAQIHSANVGCTEGGDIQHCKNKNTQQIYNNAKHCSTQLSATVDHPDRKSVRKYWTWTILYKAWIEPTYTEHSIELQRNIQPPPTHTELPRDGLHVRSQNES